MAQLQDRTQFSDQDLLQLRRYWNRGMTSLGFVCREKITAAANQLNVDTEIIKVKVKVHCSVTTETPRAFAVLRRDVGNAVRNLPPDRSYRLTTNRVNRVANKLPKLFKSYLVFD